MFEPISSHAGDNDDPLVDGNNRYYLISAINLNLFKLKEFASYKNDDDSSVVAKWPTLQRINIIREQESDKDILDWRIELRMVGLPKQNKKSI